MPERNSKKPLSENIYRNSNGYYYSITINGKKVCSLQDNKIYFKTLNQAKRARDKFRDDNNLPPSKKYIYELSDKELNKHTEIKNHISSMFCISCEKNNDSPVNPIIFCDFCDDGYHLKCHNDLCNINPKCIGKVNFFCSNNCKKNIFFNSDTNCYLCNSSGNNNSVPIICQPTINDYFNNKQSLQDENIISLCDECNDFKKFIVNKKMYIEMYENNLTKEKSFEENINIWKQFLQDEYRNIVSNYFIMPNKFSDYENNILLKMQNYKCNICDTAYIKGGFENDHIITKKINGSDCLANRQYLCCSCHRTIKTRVDLIFNEYIGNANDFSGQENINNISKIKKILKSSTLKNLIIQISQNTSVCEKNILNKKLKEYILKEMKN